MTDREMLELAAKAAGYRLEEAGVSGEQKFYLPGEMEPWNPLTDDGDALRLAVKLRFSVTVFDDAVGIGSKYRKDAPYEEFPIVGGDYEAATRLAIVRAAAAIGEQMEKKA